MANIGLLGPGVGANMLAGFASGLYASKGDLQAGLMGAWSAGALYGVGFMDPGAGRIIAHRLVGGVRQAASGGKFSAGFLAGAFTQSLSDEIGDLDPGKTGISIERTFAASIAGGTASVIGGGKFANGAVTGAFSRLFNDDAIGHQKEFKFRKKDPYPEKYGRDDVISEAVDKVVNSPDGKVKIWDGQQSQTIEKSGEMISYSSDDIRISGEYRINSNNSIDITNIHGEIPVFATPNSVHMSVTSEGAISIEFTTNGFFRIGPPDQVILDRPPSQNNDNDF